jgi:hypothetical protein
MTLDELNQILDLLKEAGLVSEEACLVESSDNVFVLRQNDIDKDEEDEYSESYARELPKHTVH